MDAKIIVMIAFAVLLQTACGSSPGRYDASTAAPEAAAAAKPRNQQCVAGCTSDYSICVTRGDGTKESNTECEAEFRACADTC